MRVNRRINFPYKTYRGFPCPIITIGLKGFDIDAYVDTGAFYSVFSSYEADVIGIDYKRGQRISVLVGDGNVIPVYLHHLSIALGPIKFNAVIGFSEKLGVGFNLLGRRSIFERFIVVFDDVKKQVTFIPR